jgi:hypothetical protein
MPVTIQPTTRVVVMAMPRKRGEGQPYHVMSGHVHITTVGKVQEFAITEGRIRLSPLWNCLWVSSQQWRESHLGGELSKFGIYPTLRVDTRYFECYAIWVAEQRSRVEAVRSERRG